MEIANGEVRTYEDWIGEFPTGWSTGDEVPPFPGNWKEVMRQFLPLSDERSGCGDAGEETGPSINSIRKNLDVLSIHSTTPH